MNLSEKSFMDAYEETQEDYWLAAVALSCLNDGEPIPDIAQNYVKSLLLGVMEKKSSQKSKSETFMRHEGYLEEMRWLIFLTGTSPEDAAERIIYTSSDAAGEDKKLLKVPSIESLLNWWYNRSQRLKEPMTIKDLGPLFDCETADSYEQMESNFSADITGKPLRVRQEIRDQIPERHPDWDDFERYHEKMKQEN